MDLKLLEDLAALARCGSFVKAAEERHVTHPAFGRRIRALEDWAGLPLVTRDRPPVRLTAQGRELLEQTSPLLEGLLHLRQGWRDLHGTDQEGTGLLRIGTGRTLARTLVADWLGRLRSTIRGARVQIHTRAMAEISAAFERGEVDFLICYEHPALSNPLAGQRFRHVTLANDRLMPVARVDAAGRVRHGLFDPEWIGYAPSLTLGRLLNDHLGATRPGQQPPPAILCDSADAVLELAIKGLGMAWLPHSLASAAVKAGLLKVLGGRGDQIHFEVRLYRHRARQSGLIEAAWDMSNR
jgi:LysR family transcriptional regulator, hypochlorite-specific transcription factor HypT